VKCILCCRQILPHEKVIRVIVEEVSRDEKEDGSDPSYFSKIEDWDIVSGMHSMCVRSALRQGKTIPYIDEIKKLGTAKESMDKVGQLRLVEGGSL